jgi:Mrp family chromosome partitioning ATPase
MSRVADALRRANFPTPDADAFTTHGHPWGGDLEIGDTESGWSNASVRTPQKEATEHSARPAESRRDNSGQKPTPLAGISPVDDLPASMRQQIAGVVDRVFLPTSREAPRMVAFADIDTDAGSGWVAAAVADMLALRTAASVAMVDMHFADPRVHELFGIDSTPGLNDALGSDTTLVTIAQRIRANLSVIPAGKAEIALELTTGSRAQIAHLASAYDHVIVSLEPLASWRGGGIPAMSDGIVLVIAADATRRAAARTVADRLQASGTTILGAVLTNRRDAIPEAIYRRL